MGAAGKPAQFVYGLLPQVSRALRKRRIAFKRLENSYTLKCEHIERGIRFELEVCRLPRLEGVCFVNMKRISGDTFAWKEFCGLSGFSFVGLRLLI